MYIIKETDSFENANVAKLENTNGWAFPKGPDTEARMILRDGTFFVKLTCKERDPFTRYTENYDPVYNDSCMEGFFNFDPKNSDKYINIETNSNGAVLSCIGSGRHEREKVIDLYGLIPKVTASKTADSWTVEIEIPADLIKAAYGVEPHVGMEFIGNFYKCQGEGDEHYATFAPIDTPKPDYHRPEFFVPFKVEKA